jgi:CRP-like cAMP-binding protein
MKPAPRARRVSEEAQQALRGYAQRFVQPTAADYAQLLRLAGEQRMPAKTYLARPGEGCSHVHLLLSGVARHFCSNGGQDNTVGFSLPGELLTDVTSFFSRQPCQLNLVAVTRLHTVSLTYEQVQQLYEACPVWERCGRLILETHVNHLTHRALSMQLKPAVARYEDLMHEHPELFNLVPLHQLASYLGIAKETLSRLRRRKTLGDQLTEP